MEGAAYLVEPHQKVVDSEGLVTRREILGWGPQRAGEFHSQRTDPSTGAVIFSADYSIDENLTRKTASTEAGPAIAFFGDSLTFGVGLNDADTLPQQFADLGERKQRVVNAAFPGYGPQHFLRALETGLFDTAIGADPKLFVFLTSPWHVERTACKASWVLDAPKYALEDGRVTFKGPCYAGGQHSLRQFLWHSALYRMIFDTDRRKAAHADIETYIAILVAATDLAKQKYHAETLIPYLKASDDYLRGAGISNDEIIARLRQGGAMVIDVTLEKEQAAGAPLSIPGDGHPTPLANTLRARLLKNAVLRDQPDLRSSALE